MLLSRKKAPWGQVTRHIFHTALVPYKPILFREMSYWVAAGITNAQAIQTPQPQECGTFKYRSYYTKNAS
ncbi:hypothetical protein AIQ34_23950 [Salmonella enterica]|nr:hypothetical protein [Salmonella enterica]